MLVITDSNSTSKLFPLGLLSPLYHRGDDGRSWLLISFGLKRSPSWASAQTNQRRQWCAFREISYVNANGQVEGLGRSWTSLNALGLALLIRMLNPFNPKPLGVAMQSSLQEDFEILLIDHSNETKVLNPYRISPEPISSYKRIVKQHSTGKPIAFTEEEIIDKDSL